MARRDSCNGTCGTSFRAKRWLSLNGCGISCVALSFGIHVFSLLTLGLHFLGPGSTAAIWLYFCLYVPAFTLAVASLYMAWTTDPGAVPMGAMPLYHPSFGDGGEASQSASQVAAGDGKADLAAGGGGEDLESGLARAVMGAAAVAVTGGAVAAATANGGGDSQSMPAVDEGLKQRAIGGSSSHNKAADPGAVTATTTAQPGRGTNGMTSPSASSSRGVRRCRKCNDNFKPPRAHHDSVTGRCVVKLDHYCPWVGNAVGALNHKFFVLFVLYTFVTSLTSGALIIMTFARCGAFTASLGDGDDDAQQQQQAAPEGCPYGAGRGYTIPFLILLPVTFLFLVFTFCMLVEQIVAITKNTSKIARMKMRAGMSDADELGRVATDFNEMFGGDSARVAWHWFVPLPVRFPSEGGRDAVLGYRYDPSTCGDGGPWRAGATGAGGPAGAGAVATGAGTSAAAVASAGAVAANGGGTKGAVASALEKVANSTSPVNSLLNRRSGHNSPATKIPYSRLENQDEGGLDGGLA